MNTKWSWKGNILKGASGCVLGCFTAFTCAHFLRVWLCIFMYPNFGAVASAMNNKIEIGKESATGCVLCPEEPGIRQCAGTWIKHKKSRAPSRRGQAGRLCISWREIRYFRSLEEMFICVQPDTVDTCSNSLKETEQLESNVGKSKMALGCHSWLYLSQLPRCLPSISQGCLLLLWDSGDQGASSHIQKGLRDLPVSQ